MASAMPFFQMVTDRNPPLQLVTGPDSTTVVKPNHNLFLKQFEDVAKELAEDDGPLIAQIAGAFLGPYTWAVDPAGLIRLFELTVRVAADRNHLSNVVLNVGVGGSEEGVPLRALAYVLPLLETLKALRSVDGTIVLPQIRLFTGQMMAAACLGKDEDLLWRNTMMYFALVKLFTRRFYSELENLWIFDFDRPLSWGNLKGEVIEKLKKALQRRANSDGVTREALEVLEKMASGHSDDDLNAPLDSALLYGAGHPTAFGDFGYQGPAHTRFLAGDKPSFMVGWGSRAEMKFWKVRQVLTAQAPKVLDGVVPIPWIMFFTKVGWDKPPYYRHPKGDINWAAVLEWPRLWNQLPGTVQRELQFLADCVGGVTALLDWVAGIHGIFAEVEGTGPHAEELLAHAVLGSPMIREVVIREGGDPDDLESLAIWVVSLPASKELELARLVRKECMGI